METYLQYRVNKVEKKCIYGRRFCWIWMDWVGLGSVDVTHKLASEVGEVADDERGHERAQDGKHDN